VASVGVKGEALTGTTDTTSSHQRSPRKLHSGDEISHGGTRSKRSANERPSHLQGQNRPRTGDEWQDPMAQLTGQLPACLLEKRSDDGVPEAQLRVMLV